MENKNENVIKVNDITASIMLDECDKIKEHPTIGDQYTLNVIRNMLMHYVTRTKIEPDSLISDPVCERITKYDFTVTSAREIQKAFIPLFKRIIDYTYLYGGLTKPTAMACLIDLMAKVASLSVLEEDDCLELLYYINNFKGCEGVDLLSIYRHSEEQISAMKNKIMEELKNA